MGMENGTLMKRMTALMILLAALLAVPVFAQEAEQQPAKKRVRLVVKTWYNGYSPEERSEKFHAFPESKKQGLVPPRAKACMICNDPGVPLDLHSEDYSKPYLYDPPAVYALCKSCHRSRLHTRFRSPQAWEAFLAHVRRGGYARDLRENPEVAAEMKAFSAAQKKGEALELKQLRHYPHEIGTEWFTAVRMDKESLTDPAARPRP